MPVSRNSSMESKFNLPLFVSICSMLFGFFAGCALQVAPGGGDIDKVPPKITEAYPPDGTMNFNNDYFEMTFSEYVDKRSFKDAIFISPAIEGELDVSWTNRTVEVTFPEKLKANRTYTVTIGTDVVDYNNRNRMASAYTMRFSTGSKIDNGRIEGMVYDAKPSGIMIYAYLMDSADVNPAYKKPDYISQVGDSGSFSLQGLTTGRYRILALRDQFKDFLFQSDQDDIGVTSRDIIISDSDSLANGLTFQMQKVDTVKPRLLSAAMTDRYHLLAAFSEELRFNELRPDNFRIFDSTANREITTAGFFKGKTNGKEFVLAVKDSVNAADKVTLAMKNFSDLAGNITPLDIASIAASDKPDTNAPMLISVMPRQPAYDIDYNKASFVLCFDDFINPRIPQFVLQDTSKNKVDALITRLDDASFKIVPVKKLKPFTDYQLLIPMKGISDLAGNSSDTTIINRYKTINDLDFTGVYGRVLNADSSRAGRLELRSLSDDSLRYSAPVPRGGKFAFEKVLAGKYRLFFYYDDNGNSKWDDGFPFPFKSAEPALFMKDQVNLPARWSVTDVNFDVKGFK